MTDEQAMWRVQMQDDGQAFAQLVQRWERPMQRLCSRMLGDVHRGQDLAQETFARLYTHRKTYQARSRFSTFLWRIALNLCYDELRKVRRRGESALNDLMDDSDDTLPPLAALDAAPDAQVVDQERADLVRQALLRLAEPYRSVVILRHYENLKFREIAEVLDIPEGTVKSRMAEALTQLHRFLDPWLKPDESKLCKPQTKRIAERLSL